RPSVESTTVPVQPLSESTVAVEGDLPEAGFGLDYREPLAGYDRTSAWPTECGGPRRQKACRLPGPDLQTGEQLAITTRNTGLAAAMFVHRGPDELYLQGGTGSGQSAMSFGWLEKVDPLTLETIFRSPDLPSGGHNYVGSVSVHENRDLYVVNGRYCHRLDARCQPVAMRELPADAPYNGFQIMSDGNLVMKNLGIPSAAVSTFVVLEPDHLEILSQLALPDRSVGRFSVDRNTDGEFIYATTDSAIHRIRYDSGELVIDDSWLGSYNVANIEQSFAWDNSVGGGRVWFTDAGKIPFWDSIVSADPVGSAGLSLNPVQAGPLSLFGFSVRDASDVVTMQPFGTADPYTTGPPLFDQERSIAVAYDIAAQKLGAWRFDEDTGTFESLWLSNLANTEQILYWPDTGELLVEDTTGGFFGGGDDGSAYAVVVDIETGIERARIDTTATAGAGMWFTPGFNRDFYYTSTLNPGVVARCHIDGRD
ncbi:MAG: hypothetical protein ACI9C1_003598, partial [Candidatus Aldehydirespiratoraceae bacterium]